MDKHILLTTMSTFPPNYKSPSNKKVVAVPNYYKIERDDKTLYCKGVLQTEAGSKFFLSSDIILDKIIAIVSPETVYENGDSKGHLPDLHEIENAGAFVDLAEKRINDASEKDKAPLSAFGYYAYRLGKFLRQTDNEPGDLLPIVEEKRKRDLEKLTADVFSTEGSANAGEWFHLLDSGSKDDQAIFNIIKERLKEDIEKRYINPDTYRNYLGSVDDAIKNFKIESTLDTLKEQATLKEDDLKNLKAEITNVEQYVKKTYSLQSIAMELQYKSFQNKLESEIADLQKERTLQKAEVYDKIITILKGAIESLIIELRDLKSNRLRNEENYIKAYLYSQMDGKYKLGPNTANQNTRLLYVKDRIPVNGTNGSETSTITNITGIVNAICPEGTTDDVHLYIDMQGGSRTQGYVLNAILTILNNESTNKVRIEKIVTTAFEKNKFTSAVTDDTKRYKIIDLASGMNAFIQYGRADQLRTYFETVYDGSIPHQQLRTLIDEMQNVDRSLSICDIDSLENAITNIYGIFSSRESDEVYDEFSGSFNAMIEEIRQDYSSLLVPVSPADMDNMRIDYLALTKWAYRKHFIQQAITIIESKMPRFFIDTGILYYRRRRDSRNFINNIRDKLADELIRQFTNNGQNYLAGTIWTTDTTKQFPWQFSDIDHCIFTHYITNNYDNRQYNSYRRNAPAFPQPCDSNVAGSVWKLTSKLLSLINTTVSAHIKLRTEIDLSNPDNLNLLKETFFLYFYLRNIRNEINHSSSGNRYSYATIDELISRFLELCDQLSGLSQDSTFTAAHTDSSTVYNRAIIMHNNSLNNSANTDGQTT